MKAEQIIVKDIKETLNYYGPVFLKVEKKILAEQGKYLLEIREKYCSKCHKKTSHEWVRNRDFHYWRCSECLRRHVKAIGVGSSINYCNQVSNNLET